MALAIFDLDNTLISGDSDHAWGEYLVEQGQVDQTNYAQINDDFYEQYKSGNLDIIAYLEFAAAPLCTIPTKELERLREGFLHTKIAPLMLPKAQKLIEEHRNIGDTLLIITATNQFVTQPIAKQLRIPHLLSSELAIENGCFTGKVAGIPCFQQGKIDRLNLWLTDRTETLAGSYFYSDSINDVPLLNIVDHPFAVDPDEKLREHAKNQNWKIISLRSS